MSRAHDITDSLTNKPTDTPTDTPIGQRAGKRIGIGMRPPATPQAEAWIRQGEAATLPKGDLYTARLTLDVTPALRARIKVSAFTQGVTVAELLRGLMVREFPEIHMEHRP